MLLSAWIGLAWAQEGACRASWAEIEVLLDGAEAAWGVDEAAFSAALDRLGVRLPCLAGVVTPAQAARVHRVEGLAAFLARDMDRAGAAFAAARAADPAGDFPPGLVPDGNPVRRLFDGATAPADDHPLPPPKRGRLILDGAPGERRPEARATLFQLADADTALTTAWLPPGAPTPAYPARGEGLRLPLLVTAGVAAAGGGALWALAARLEADPPALGSEEDYQALVARNHGLVYGAAGLGLLAVGSGAGAFVWGRW